MKSTEFSGSKVLILGFGKEGMATFEFLREKYRDMRIGIADKKLLKDHSKAAQLLLQEQNVELYFGDEHLRHFEEYDIVIKSPGITRRIPEIEKAIQNGIQFTSATNIFFSEAKGEIIGVTGSKGKSTTATLIFRILKKAGKNVELVGNVGKPALEFLKTDSENKIYIFELSSYQLEDLEIPPKIGVITSFFPEHLDYHGSEEAYFAAKMGICANMKSDDILVYNAKFEKIRKFVEKLSCRVLPTNDGKSSLIQDGNLIHNSENILRISDVRILGTHNLENILLCIAVAKLFDVENSVIQAAVKEFKGLEHRLEFIGEFRKIRFFDDAISTTPESAIAAISAFGNDLGTLILGGYDRGLKFSELTKEILARKVPNVILMPDTGKRIADEIKNSVRDFSPNITWSDTLSDAVQKAYEVTPSGKVCVLSPASPSYNQFKNFEEKGRMFREDVVRFGAN